MIYKLWCDFNRFPKKHSLCQKYIKWRNFKRRRYIKPNVHLLRSHARFQLWQIKFSTSNKSNFLPFKFKTTYEQLWNTEKTQSRFSAICNQHVSNRRRHTLTAMSMIFNGYLKQIKRSVYLSINSHYVGNIMTINSTLNFINNSP